MAHEVTLMVRATCGSCARVESQIKPVVLAHGSTFATCDVATDKELAMEYGDRGPVILIDGDEFACWEVDNDELIEALGK